MSSILIKGAQIVTMDDAIGDFDRGDILIENGAIKQVAAAIDAAGAETIDAADMIAMPGIVEAHNCLWQTVLRGYVPNLWFGTYFTKMLPLRLKYRPEDNFNAAYIGGFETLSYGATTVVDYCHNVRGPGYAEASISALRETGIRHVFTHSFMNAKPDHFASEQAQYDYAKQIYDEFHDPDTLTTINFGVEFVRVAQSRKAACIHPQPEGAELHPCRRSQHHRPARCQGPAGP